MSSNFYACRRCLYTLDHPLGLTIDEEGICSGCRIHEEKDSLDWLERWERLVELVKPYRSKVGNYDCIIPVSGANDSYYIVHLVKEVLGLNPLLVSYNKYFNTPLGIANLANLRIRFNCDILIQNINPHSVKAITRATLRQFGSIYWPCIAGQTVFPVQTAVRYGIPLIFWGAHQGLEQVGMFSHTHEVEMTRRYRKDHDLMGYEADDLLSIFDTLREDDIWQYRYPDDKELHEIGVKGIYLGNYVRWDPKAQHEKMIDLYRYRSAACARTFDCYDHVDCFNYIDLHDQIKSYKNGFSKVTDHASREIRHGRLSRQQGLFLVRAYEHQQARFSGLFQEWLGVTDLSLQFLLDQHRDMRFWELGDDGQWGFNGASTKEGVLAPHLNIANINFQANNIWDENDARYITIGKGYP